MVLEIFPLKNGDFSFWKICSWRFFLEDLFWRLNFWKNFNEDLFMDIFPWRFILRDFSIEVLEIFIEDLFIGDFSFEKWRIFLLKMEIFFFFLKNLFFEWEQLWLEVNVDCWISPWLNSCKKIISISNGFIHWNELEVLTPCP